MSSHYGIFDNAGFPKVGTHYYNAWWRDFSRGTVGVSISPDDWTAPVPVGKPIEIDVTTTATFVELFINGVLQTNQAAMNMDVPATGVSPSSRVPVPRFGFARWLLPFAPGNITAVAYNTHGVAVASHTVRTAGKPARLRASVAAPYLHGRNALEVAADGQDAALINVELVDARGIL
eukprot:COSAG01_NODE_4315_length_5140_cov_5.930768_4_plen_177_part_00